MTATILAGDVLQQLATLPVDSVDCCVTSPPYWGLRDYGVPGQLGLEPTIGEFIEKMVAVFAEVRRVLKPAGTCWVNMGDSYAGSWGSQGRQGHGDMTSRSVVSARQIAASQRRLSGTGSRNRFDNLKPKDLVGQPWRLAFALQDDGWWLRQDIIWNKPNPMPESVRDRCTKAHEYVFLLTKSERYWYDQDAIREAASPNTNPRTAGNGVGFGHGFDAEAKPRVKKVAGWAEGAASHTAADHAASKQTGRTEQELRDGTKFGREPGWRTKNNASFNDAMAVMPSSRNMRSVWTMVTEPYAEAHFATFPTELPRRCILAGCPQGGVVLDPFAGSGTTLQVALDLGRKAIGIELNPDYVALIERRLRALTPGLALESVA